jgi:hypothetical protein
MDIRTKLPFYLSDLTDCASLQCLAATLYLYLVCLCSVVAFGGMLGAATENYMVKKTNIPITYRKMIFTHLKSRQLWNVFLLHRLAGFYMLYSLVNH